MRKMVMMAVLARPPRRPVTVDQVPIRRNMVRGRVVSASPGSSGITIYRHCQTSVRQVLL